MTSQGGWNEGEIATEDLAAGVADVDAAAKSGIVGSDAAAESEAAAELGADKSDDVDADADADADAEADAGAEAHADAAESDDIWAAKGVLETKRQLRNRMYIMIGTPMVILIQGCSILKDTISDRTQNAY